MISKLLGFILIRKIIFFYKLSESDNLGSTDSEVKKILTLHLPITEYEDDASDDASAPAHSDSETGARLPRPSHPTAC